MLQTQQATLTSGKIDTRLCSRSLQTPRTLSSLPRQQRYNIVQHSPARVYIDIHLRCMHSPEIARRALARIYIMGVYHALAPGWWTGAEHQRAIDYVNTRICSAR